MKSLTKVTSPFIVAVLVCIPGQSHAYLGGVEAQDGYLGFVNWVNGYDAGQSGTSNGGPGGSPSNLPQPPITDFPGGLWHDLNDAFATYNANTSVFAGGYYVTGHTEVTGLGMVPHSGEQMLALRNTTYATIPPTVPAQPLDYRYTLDARDFYNGGNPISPANTGDKIVNWSVWISPGPKTAPSDGVWLSFRDSQSAPDNPSNPNAPIAFQFGWDETYQLRYRDTPGGSWNYLIDSTNANYVFGRPWEPGIPSINKPPVTNVYDLFEFSFDLLHDKWSLDVTSGLTGNIMTFVTDRAFGQNLLDLSFIDFHVSYGNEKGFFDDSNFTISSVQVPEPGTWSLLLIPGLMLRRLRGRRLR